ncbi:MAG: hypothetical protein IJJ29_09200 [Solobacterium sp.]|nr:hypothetical protein [Solobacterium sp.]
MNTIGIVNNLDRLRIRKLLIIGLSASVITGIGDFLLGYADETTGISPASALLSSAVNLGDAQLITGSLLGMFGIFLEGLSFFAVYRLMADAAPGYAHIYRAGIFGYIWLAPVGCHLNIGIMNIAYKYVVQADPVMAEHAAKLMIYGFSIPVYVLLICFWLPVIIIQYKAFAEGKTPYPRYAKWFNLITGAVPALIIAALIGPHTAIGAGIGTMFLSFGNALMFGGLLAVMPSQEQFDRFAESLQTGE